MGKEVVRVKPVAVALLAEGVDRNRPASCPRYSASVALLAEGVDRNHSIAILSSLLEWSPSSRRAWIEMSFSPACLPATLVALLSEGVDRNLSELQRVPHIVSRPPRGGRG